MKETAFPIFFNWYDRLKEFLTAEERCEVTDALRGYYESGADPVSAVKGPLRLAVALMVDQIEIARSKQQKAIEDGRRGGEKSGQMRKRPKGPSGVPEGGTDDREGDDGDGGPRSEDPPTYKNKNKNKKEKEKENENETETKKEVINSRSVSFGDKKVKKRERERETPTLTEVREYVLNERLNINPDKFFNYYESVGWKEKGQPLVDWKSKAQLWSIREVDFNGGSRYNFDSFIDEFEFTRVKEAEIYENDTGKEYPLFKFLREDKNGSEG